MSDEEVTKPSEMPPQPKTTQLPAVDPILVAITQLTREVQGARADISLVSNDLSLVKDRVTILETERGKQSGGIRQLSTSDQEQAAQLAQERAAREALAKDVADLKAGHAAIIEKTDHQTEILVSTADAVRKFVATPTVKIIGGVLFGIFSTYIANHYGIVIPK